MGHSPEEKVTASEVICPLREVAAPALVLLFHRKEVTTFLGPTYQNPQTGQLQPQKCAVSSGMGVGETGDSQNPLLHEALRVIFPRAPDASPVPLVEVL